MAVVERWPLVEIGLLLITERRDLIQSLKVHFVVTLFDCKDENSFGFSLFVDVRFKLCSVLLIWIKHLLLFRNTIEPPLTTTSPQWPPTAISLQWPFFFLADSPYTESCFNFFTTATSLQRPFFSLRTVHILTLVSTSLQRPPVYYGHFIIQILMRYQDFSLYQEIISSSRAVKILFLSFTCEDIGVAMVTNINFDFLEQKI